jgi:superfamily II DNA or RNA helicase
MLCRSGLIISKDSDAIPKSQIDDMKTYMTAITGTDTIRYYRESDSMISFPYSILFKFPLQVQEHKTYRGQPFKNTNMELSIGLQDHQKYMKDIIIGELDTNRRAFIQIAGGLGKSLLAIAIALERKMKFIIAIHSTAHLSSWKSELDRISGQATYDVLSSKNHKKILGNPPDILLLTIHTFSSDYSTEKLFRPYGLLIIDEAHHCTSKKFSYALVKFNFFEVIGLSGTTETGTSHNGMLSRLFPKFSKLPEGLVKRVQPKIEFWCYNRKSELDISRTIFFDGAERLDYSYILEQVRNDPDRIEFVANTIAKLLANEDARLLVLCLCNSYRDKIAALLKIKVPDIAPEYLTPQNLADHTRIKDEGRLIFSTYAYASEGFDAKKLNTVVAAEPKKSNLAQVVWRIMRGVIFGTEPRMIQIYDKYSIFIPQHMKARKLYQSYGFNKFRYIE